MKPVHLILAALLSVIAAPTTTALAGDAPPVRASGRATVVKRRATITLDVHSSRDIACMAKARLGRAQHQLPPVITSQERGARRWQFRVAKGVPAGRWTLSVSCVIGNSIKQAAPVRVRAAAGPAGRFVRSRLVEPASVVISTPQAPLRVSGHGENPYPPGDCTWWAWDKRTDLPFFAGADGHALNWVRSAAARGIPTGTVPVAGAIAVFQPRQNGAGKLGHVAYVERVDGETMTISEANFASWPIGHTRTVAWRSAKLTYVYGGIAGDGAGNVTQKAPPLDSTPRTIPRGAIVRHVRGTCASGTCGAERHSGPGLSGYQLRGRLLDGTAIVVSCQRDGETVTGADAARSAVWDQLDGGDYVPDVHVDSPVAVGQFDPAVPRCDGPPPPKDVTPRSSYAYHVVRSCEDNPSCMLRERSGPGIDGPEVKGLLPEGATVQVVCQMEGQAATGREFSTKIWNRLDDGWYVSDYYLDTPGGNSGYTDPIPRCS